MENKKRKISQDEKEISFVLPSADLLKEDENELKKWKEYVDTINEIIEEVEESKHNLLYFELIEKNDWEGETWHFYCGYEKETKEEFESLLEKLDFGGRSSWELGSVSLTKREVDLLVAHADGGYMASHSYGEDHSLEELKTFVNCERCLSELKYGEQEWYKGDYSFDCRHLDEKQ